MPYLQIDDLRVHYRSAGDGPPLVLVHSYPTHSQLWQPQVEALRSIRRVVTYDVRGLGKTDAPQSSSAYSQERSVADLLGLLDALEIRRADLCGLSMGGNIALNFALAHPERVSRLIIIGTGAGSDDSASFARTTNAWATIAESQGMQAFARELIGTPIFSEYSDRGPEEYRRLWSLLTAHTAHGVAHTAREVLARRPTIGALTPRLKLLPVSTLIVVGSEDHACIGPAQLMADIIPKARYQLVPHAGHLCNLEDSEAVNRLITDFLSLPN